MIHRYTCKEAFRRLDDYVDRELPASEMQRVQEHLQTCAVCACEFEFEASALEAVRRKLRRISAPQALMERVSLRLRSAGPELHSEPS